MNWLAPETLIAITGLITALLTGIGTFIVSRRSAKKSEIVLLRNEVSRLQNKVTNLTDEVDLWQKRYNSLFNYVLVLKTCLVENDIDIPQSGEVTADGEDAVVNLTNSKNKKKNTTRKKRIPGAKAPEEIGKPSDSVKYQPVQPIDDDSTEESGSMNLGG